jgi:hypothetical protein
MSEFVFKNLSVRLHPEVGCEQAASSPLILCYYDTRQPTGALCNLNASRPVRPGCLLDLSCGAWCTMPDTFPVPTNLWPIKVELAALKEQLRQTMAEVEATEQQVDAAGKPKSIEEIDQLKSQLLAAVAELDEQRSQMEGKGPG